MKMPISRAHGPKACAAPAPIRWLGETPPGVWTIKDLVPLLDPRICRLAGGRQVSTGRHLGRILLLTTERRTGEEHTTPVFYLRDGERPVICNANSGFERPNPLSRNLRDLTPTVGPRALACTRLSYGCVGRPSHVPPRMSAARKGYPSSQAHGRS